MTDKRACNDVWFPEPFSGFGSCHNLSDDAGRVFGEQGARIRVRPKPRPIGFQVPRGKR